MSSTGWPIVVQPTIFDDPKYPLIRDERELAAALRSDIGWWGGTRKCDKTRWRKKDGLIDEEIGKVRVWTFMRIGGAWVGHGKRDRGVDMELVEALLRCKRLRVCAGYYSITTLKYKGVDWINRD